MKLKLAIFAVVISALPGTYIPPEITTCFSDPEAYRLLVTAVDMRERGAKLTDEDLERLVEWLGRVWGTNQDK